MYYTINNIIAACRTYKKKSVSMLYFSIYKMLRKIGNLKSKTKGICFFERSTDLYFKSIIFYLLRQMIYAMI